MLNALCRKLLIVSVLCALPAYGADTVKIKPLGIVYQDANNLPLKSPEGVACAKSTVLVADSGNGRMVRYSVVNDELKNGMEIKVAEISYPLRVKAISMDRTLVLDGKTRKIARLAADGSFVGFLEYQGMPAPVEIVPRSMATDAKNNIYVLDILGERVVVVDSAGTFLRQIPFPKEYGFFSDLAVDQKGSLLLLDSLKGQVLRGAADKAEFQAFASGLQSAVNFAVSMDLDSQGRVYLLDQNGGAVIVLGTDGSFQGRYLSFGWKGGQLNYPSQMCIMQDNNLAIADRNNNSIQLFKIQ